MKNFIQFLAIVLIMSSCVTTANLTSEEQAYLNKAQNHPLTFEIDSSNIDKAWGRAQSFIGKYSSMKLQNVTDYVIQTYYPQMNDANFGYKVTKTELENGSFELSVNCITGNMFTMKSAEKNAHVLAYYIKTGKRPSSNIISS
ncbi:MAG: hypothetical protein ACQER7_03730 [Bacteroidota bacterium]